MLNDHPVLLGEHLRSITLWPAESAAGENVIHVVADREWALRFPQTRIEAYKRMALDDRAIFGGGGHYRKPREQRQGLGNADNFRVFRSQQKALPEEHDRMCRLTGRKHS